MWSAATRPLPSSPGRPIIGAIDVHAHFYPPRYVSEVTGLAAQDGAAAAAARRFIGSQIIRAEQHFTGAIATRLALMDAAGVDVQVLSMASMNIWHPDPDGRRRLTESYNDGLAEVCVQHPDRFRFVASLPFPHVEEAVGEVHRVRDLPGCIGYAIPTMLDGHPIDSPRWTAVYEAMNALPALVTVHPDGFGAPGYLSDYSMEWAIGAVFEDTVAAVRLLCAGLVTNYANLRWLVPHLGGTLPFVLHRITWRWRFEAELLGLPQRDVAVLQQLMFDTANSSPDTLKLASAVLPVGSLAYGTDFPFLDKSGFIESWEMARDFVGDLTREAPAAVHDLVYGSDSLTMGIR